MKLHFINDWCSHYGGALIMVAWFRLDSYKAFTIVFLGIGLSITKGSLDV